MPLGNSGWGSRGGDTDTRSANRKLLTEGLDSCLTFKKEAVIQSSAAHYSPDASLLPGALVMLDELPKMHENHRPSRHHHSTGIEIVVLLHHILMTLKAEMTG